MCCSFHHGKCLHWLWYHPYYHDACWTALAQADGQISRVLRLIDHSSMGLRQYLHRAPLGWSLGRERHPAHYYGRHLVGCGACWGVVEQRQAWPTKAQLRPWFRHLHYWLGNVWSPTTSHAQHYDPQDVWLHLDGCWIDSNYRGLFRPP